MEENVAVVEQKHNYLNDMISNSFVWSIISMMFCGSGLLGLIFALVARSKAKSLIAAGAGEDKMVKAANSLSKIALILSIILMALIVLYFILFAAIIGTASNALANVNW